MRLYPAYFNRAAQEFLVKPLENADYFTPKMPKTGKEFSVKMTNLGELGWVSDITGYRYQARHPASHQPWGAMPTCLTDLWSEVAGFHKPPQACLVNYYHSHAKMGLHQDRDEVDFTAPVVSVSLGATALFRMGGLNRADKTHSIKLSSGDVIVFGGKARLMFHGVDRIYENTSTLLPQNGRINLTLRRVN